MFLDSGPEKSLTKKKIDPEFPKLSENLHHMICPRSYDTFHCSGRSSDFRIVLSLRLPICGL